jgi:hypothetical protein
VYNRTHLGAFIRDVLAGSVYRYTLYRDPATVFLTVTDSRGRTATSHQTIRFINDEYGGEMEISSTIWGTFGTAQGIWGPFHPECVLGQTKALVPATLPNVPIVISKSVATVRVACPGSRNCFGTALLSLSMGTALVLRSNARASSARKRPRRAPPFAIGAATFDIPAGKTVDLPVQLSKSALHQLRVRRTRKVTVQLRTLDPSNGKSKTEKKTLKLIVKR